MSDRLTPDRLSPPPLDLDAFPRRVGKLASQVAHAYGLHGAAALEDLQSAGYVRALRLTGEFRPTYPRGYEQPDNAFWGWAYREVLTEIQREAARLLAGGTIRSPRRVKGAAKVIARPMSDYYEASGSNDFAHALPDLHCPPAELDDDDTAAPPAEAKRAMRSAGERLLEAGACFGKFVGVIERLAGVDFAMSATVENDGDAIRYFFSDGRSRHFFRLFADGTLEHRAAALPPKVQTPAPGAAERN